MIIVLKKGATQQDIDKLTNLVTAHGVQVNPVIGTELTILGLVGDTSQVDPNRIESFPCVERIMHVAEPFKKANRMFHPEDTVVDVAGVPVGGKRLAVMAGPCSVESREQVTGIAQAVKGQLTILVDGGIRTGTDVCKALALGADACILARPYVTAVYGGGAEGVMALTQKLKGELEDTMAMCGVHSLKEIDRSCVRVPTTW